MYNVTLEMIFGFYGREGKEGGNQSFMLECLLMKENYTLLIKTDVNRK